MAKIYAKCKDKTSSRWLPSQGVSVVGDIPKQINKTAEVSTLIKKGVLIEVSTEEYDRFHKEQNKKRGKKAKDKTNKEVLSETIIKLEDALSKKNPDEARKYFKTAKNCGLKGEEANKIADRIVVCEKEALDAEALKVREEAAPDMVADAIEKEIIKPDENSILCLGEKQIGADADKAILWVVETQDNFDELTKAIEDYKPAQTGGNE